MQLSQYPYKFGPDNIYKVVHLYPPDLAIEASLGEEWGSWENPFSSKQINHLIQKGVRV